MPFRNIPITLPVQLHYLKSAYPQSEGGIYGKVMNWTSWVRPSPVSADYRLEVQYSIGTAPKIWAREPDLKTIAGGKKPPHIYHEDTQELCLYRPRYREWHRKLLLSRTVIPWAVLWFYYFEIWLVTGTWPGNGEHPVADGSEPETA
jgi:hypothetical protein